jgi:predicted dehydrogenase
LKSVSAQLELGGGALLELSHELDYAAWLLGELKLEHAVLKCSDELGLKVEDTADIMCSTSKDVVAHIHLDFLQKKANRRCRVVGTEGALEWDLIKNQVRLITNDNDGEALYFEPDWDRNQMYINMMMEFLSTSGQMQGRATSVAEATKTVSLIESIKCQFPIRNI